MYYRPYRLLADVNAPLTAIYCDSSRAVLTATQPLPTLMGRLVCRHIQKPHALDTSLFNLWHLSKELPQLSDSK